MIKLITKIHRALRTGIIIFAGTLVLASNASVYALTDDAIRSIVNGTPWYDSSDVACSAENTTLDGFLKGLALQESGGDPLAQSSTTTASGKYQYLDSTWAARKSIYGPSQQYVRAKDAPEPVQDAVAYIEYAQKFDSLDGDIENLAMSHFYPDYVNKKDQWDEVAPAGNGGITYRQYVDTLISKIDSAAADSIALQYSAAPDFQTWLTKAGITGAVNTSASSGASASCSVGDFVYYSQYDSRWANEPYGTDTILNDGCGTTSLAMVVATLTKNTAVTPKETALWSYENGYNYGDGTSWGLFEPAAKNYGLRYQAINTMDEAISVLTQGGLVITSGTGAKPYTGGGHMLVLRGVSSDGTKLVVADPNRWDDLDSTLGGNEEYGVQEVINAGAGHYWGFFAQ